MDSILRRLLYWFYTLLGLEAVRLNLRITKREPVAFEWWHKKQLFVTLYVGRFDMAKIGDTFTATIKPTNAKGDPAPVFNALYVDGSSYDVAIAADGLSAVFTAKAAGSGNAVVVTATSKSGVTLTDTKPLPDVDAPAVDDEAVALNLTVA